VHAVVLGDGPPELELAEVADPEPGPDEVVLAVRACGICGSDLHVASAIGAPGTILGHEIAGEVVGLGTDVDPDRWEIGRPVAARPTTGCGRCAYCTAGRPDHCAAFRLVGLDRPGGFAELVAVPAAELFGLPASLTGADQALVEPMAIARRALRRTALQPGETVAVIGAGPIGLATTHWARALGAGTIVVSDPAASRRDLALRLGADVAVDPTNTDLGAAVLQATDRAPAAVIECSGRPEQIAKAMDHAGIDGRVTIVSVCLSEASIFPFTGLAKELDLRFSLYYGREDFIDTLRALDDGSLDPRAMITETVNLDGLPERFARLIDQPEGGKVVIIP
jgi:(R,R)-butanediol dehydrogenase/meso-butanediol dehydrogenase/diacetyl reductase